MNINKPTDRFLNLPFIHYKEKPTVDAADNPRNELRFPFIGFLPNKIRNHFIAFCGEFCGTFLFLFFAFSATQVANAAASGGNSSGSSGLSQVPNASTLAYISLAFGFSLAVNAWVFFRISGGLFNPAVTLGMALIGGVTWVRAGLAFIAQILGSICSAAVVSALFPGPMNVNTTLGGGSSTAQGLFIEMFCTAELVFTIFMLAAEKHKGTFLAPIGIGLALFIAELTAVYFTGGSLNPARSFGPCVVTRDFTGYHWIYWLGPFLGSILAVSFYRFVKVLEYETANPGQDFNEKEAEVFEFDEENAATGADVSRPNVNAMVAPSTANLADARGSSLGPPGEGRQGRARGATASTFSSGGPVSPVPTRGSMDVASAGQMGSPGRRSGSGQHEAFRRAPEAEAGEMGASRR